MNQYNAIKRIKNTKKQRASFTSKQNIKDQKLISICHCNWQLKVVYARELNCNSEDSKPERRKRKFHDVPTDFCRTSPELTGWTLHRVCWKDAMTIAPVPMCYVVKRTVLQAALRNHHQRNT